MSSGLPPPSPASTPRIFTTVRARNAIKIVDYEYPSFSQGKAPWGRGYRFPLGIVGTLRSEDGDGRENVAEKVNSCSFNLHRDYSNSLAFSNVGEPS